HTRFSRDWSSDVCSSDLKTRSGRGAGSSTTRLPDGSTVSTSGGGGISTSYDLSFVASWELDLWGRLRRSLESSQASMQASSADQIGRASCRERVESWGVA